MRLMSPPARPEELAELGTLIDAWTTRLREGDTAVVAVDYEPEFRRWYVRMRGEDKAFITVWLTLRERSLHYETYFMPAPEENLAECFEFLLRVNMRMVNMAFAIGLEDAVYLVGQTPFDDVDEDSLDEIIGAAYAYSEQYFRPAMTIGYASKFRPRGS